MPIRYRVLPYRAGSRAARALADALGGRVLRLEGSTFRPQPRDVIINYGNTDPRKYNICTVNNTDLRTATNKLSFFQAMTRAGHADIIPEYWTNQAEIPDEAFPILCRTELAGHSGAGIVIADTHAALVRAPLYVRYIPKQDEYRVHVGLRRGQPEVIALQRKARNRDVPDGEVNWRVRNHSNGFIFVRGDVNPPQSVVDNAKAALLACNLDFGAVDIIYNRNRNRSYVLEINTAPGLEGQTVQDYADFFRQ